MVVRPRVDPPPMFLLAIRGGLSLAAELGLPAVIGGPILHDAKATEAYFRNFRPNPTGQGPYLMASVEVAVADTPARAKELILSEAWAYTDSRDVGEFRALQHPDEVRRLLGESKSQRKVDAVTDWVSNAIAGTPDQVASRLADVLRRTGAAEILASVSTYDRDDVRRVDESLSLLVGPWANVKLSGASDFESAPRDL